MAESDLPVPPAPGAPPPAPPAPGAPPSAPLAESFPREYVESLRKEAAENRIALKRYQDQEAAAEQTRLAETGQHKERADKLEAQLQKAQRELADRDHAALRARIAKKHGIEEFAERLHGATEADLEADAQAFAAALPKPAPPAPPAAPPPDPESPLPTNPAAPAGGLPAGQRLSFKNLPGWGDVLGRPRG